MGARTSWRTTPVRLSRKTAFIWLLTQGLSKSFYFLASLGLLVLWRHYATFFKYLGLSATLLRRFTNSESLAWSPPWSRAWTFRPTTTRASPSGWTTLSSSSPRWPFAKRRNATAVLTRGMIFARFRVFDYIWWDFDFYDVAWYQVFDAESVSIYIYAMLLLA